MVRRSVEDVDRHGHVSVVEPHGLVLLECHQGIQSHPFGTLVRSAHRQEHLKVATCRFVVETTLPLCFTVHTCAHASHGEYQV